MIAAGFLPHPPLLLAEYASLADPGADLRSRCRDVLAQLAAARPDRLVLITGTPRVAPAIDTRGPLGVRVAEELLAGLDLPAPEVLTVPYDADLVEIAAAGDRLRELSAGRTAVLVLGDGSARRGEKAPGHTDERAFAVDRRIAEALAAGDPRPLAELDPDLAEELMIAGRAAWQVLAAAVTTPPDRVYAYAEDPFGVLYHLARWHWESEGSDD